MAAHGAVAPDVPLAAAAAWAKSLQRREQINARGARVAFAAQDGNEHGLASRHSIDVPFPVGSAAWKKGPAAHRLALEARERDLAVHGGPPAGPVIKAPSNRWTRCAPGPAPTPRPGFSAAPVKAL
ncbi:hypothetical protein ACIHIX_34075 [Streptomyces sp. NPDC051913]|uniref:hypothetical protein n=1 Tax=Streptomyces sp. NPDC051913 TaxID=3365676 RepID=UPI0037D501E8